MDSDFSDDEDFASEDEAPLRDHSLCPVCLVPGRVDEAAIFCTKCGLRREWYDYSDEVYDRSVQENHNTSNNAFASFQIVGKGCKDLHQSYRNACTEYDMLRRFNTQQEIESKIYQYKGREVPHTVVQKTVNMFEQIRENGNKVFRGNGRLGVMGACMYYSFVDEGQTRTPKEIASILEVEERYISQGDKRLLKFCERGLIELPENENAAHDFTEQFLAQLGIDMKYKAFVLDLINRANEKCLHIVNECRITTKCAGAIYFLCTRIPELRNVDKQQIADVCKISKSTFFRYYNLLMEKHPLIEKSLRRHGIPMPNSWRV